MKKIFIVLIVGSLMQNFQSYGQSEMDTTSIHSFYLSIPDPSIITIENNGVLSTNNAKLLLF